MSWQEAFYDAVAGWLRDQGKDAVRVVSVEQENTQGGYCETCWYESVEVYVSYLDSAGNYQNYYYYGSMSEFMQQIT